MMNGGKQVLFLGVVAEQLDRGAGLEHGALDARGPVPWRGRSGAPAARCRRAT